VNRLSASAAACAITAGSEEGLASVTPCVSVMNGAYRTFTTIRRAGRGSDARSTASSPAIRATSASTCDQSAMFRWNVSSRPWPRAT
jgi:hypothetical protein